MGQEINKSLLETIEQRAIQNKARVAIGIRDPTAKILRSAQVAQDAGYAHVVLVGNKKEIMAIGTDLEVFDTEEPEKALVDLLLLGSVAAAVRGTAKASPTLAYLKNRLMITRLHRTALLMTNDGKPFFLAPVGIDEGNGLSDKILLIQKGVEHIRRFGVEPLVGLLSGGRMGDLGRDPKVDQTLAEGDFIVNRLLEVGIRAKHYTILIEDAIKEADLIIAPDGISGNLIFRTLVFLGGGDGMGAPVLIDGYTFVDTSRVGGHYTKAIMLASALTGRDE